jgi:hypothetical protein
MAGMNLVISRKTFVSIIIFSAIIVFSGSANAQVIGEQSGASGVLGSGSDSSAFQQTQNQDQAATNTAQQASPGNLLLNEAAGALTVIGSTVTSGSESTAVSSESPSAALIVTLLALSALALYGLYRVNKDDWFNAETKAEAMNTHEKVEEKPKKAKASAATTDKTKTKKAKKNKKHRR